MRRKNTMALDTFLSLFDWDTAAQVVLVDWSPKSGLLVGVEAYPFWFGGPVEQDDRRRLTLRFNNILESSIDLDWDDLALEVLSVSDDDPLLWDYGQYGTIFGSAPLPDPSGFLLSYLSMCADLEILRDPIQYLVAGGNLDGWMTRVSESSYHLIGAPVKLLEPTQVILNHQRASYSVSLGPSRRNPSAALVVRIDQSWIVCEEVNVEADGE